MNKKISILLASLLSMPVIAGDYTKFCYDKGLGKQEVYNCLDDLEFAANKELEKKLGLIQNESKDMPTDLIVSNNSLSRISYSFDNYVKEQCSLIGGYAMGSGAGQESQDCRIRLITSRIKDVDYILNKYYK